MATPDPIDGDQIHLYNAVTRVSEYDPRAPEIPSQRAGQQGH